MPSHPYPQTTCRRCPAKIFFAPNPPGSPSLSNPIDWEPVANGNVYIDEEGIARYLKKGDVPEGDRFVSHFATCPEADRFRKGGRR